MQPAGSSLSPWENPPDGLTKNPPLCPFLASGEVGSWLWGGDAFLKAMVMLEVTVLVVSALPCPGFAELLRYLATERGGKKKKNQTQNPHVFKALFP